MTKLPRQRRGFSLIEVSFSLYRCRSAGIWSRGRKAGIALVMVLACLVIISVLTVAFLQAVRTDLAASTGYASGATSRMLADSALNLVIGQLQDATQRQDEAWVSQPGLIRTYDTSGNAVKAYKLYSADQLIVDGAFDPLTAGKPTDVPDSWRTDGASVWADLNDPILKAGVPHYPILSPAAIGQVEGFDAPTENLTDKSGNVVKDKNGLAYQAIPMPVKWLYVLKDGTRATVAPGTSGAVKLTSTDPTHPVSAANPPVGRIAFWTDDESSKVNINTASEGTIGDPPLCNTYASGFKEKVGPPPGYVPNLPSTVFECDLAYYQPSQGEYQRYPGHPATTSLSTVLWNPIQTALGGSATRSDILEEIYKLTPRYPNGQGTTYSATQRPGPASTTPAVNSRLYASTDELLFQPGRQPNPSIGTTDDQRRQLLDQLSFFLTAHSKAPEQNLFNLPRVAIWPINQSTAKRTPYDKLFAFCSTLKDNSTGLKHPYFFIRKNPQSATEDWGLVGDDGTVRNQVLYRYLQTLTSRSIPGFGTTSFATKYTPAERDQILTEIFDFVRSTNLLDGSQNVMKSNGTILIEHTEFYFTPKNNLEGGIVIPIEPPDGTPGAGTKGFGRYFTISEMALAATAVTNNGDGTYKLQVALVPEFYCPSTGHPNISNRYRMEFTGLSSFKIGGQPVFGNDAATMNIPNQLTKDSETCTFLGGPMGYRSSVKVTSAGSAPTDQLFPIGTISSVASGSASISGTAQISFYFDPPSGAAPVLVQQGTFRFPSVTMTVPVTTNVVDGNDLGYTAIGSAKGGRLFSSPFFRTGANQDWCRSLTPKASIASDYRLIAAIPSTQDLGDFFDKHPQWNLNTPLVHTLRPPRIPVYTTWASGAQIGKLAAGVPTSMDEQPDIVKPVGIDNGIVNANGDPGDWENSVGAVPDGPTTGRADEGEGPTTNGPIVEAIPYIGHSYVANGQSNTFELGATFFSPNRLIASPVDLGSLSTGVKRGLPWQTLLFRPARNYLPGRVAHPGAASPQDHLLLDLFWMPVVEPYPISEPFATSGRINLNYQIAPFTTIKRSTGVRAVMKSVMITALDPIQKSSDNTLLNATYKKGFHGTDAGAENVSIRYPIDLDATMKFFDERFSNNQPFISGSEICNMPLIPANIASTSDTTTALETKLASFWTPKSLTGDNSIERPYSLMYSRMTSKSNTYEVHVRCQTLNASSTGQAGEFRVTPSGEFRGSFLIERYLDPTGDGIVKKDAGGNLVPASETDASAFLGPYKVRVISSKQLSL